MAKKCRICGEPFRRNKENTGYVCQNGHTRMDKPNPTFGRLPGEEYADFLDRTEG